MSIGWRPPFFVEVLGLDELQGTVSQLEHDLKHGLRTRLKEAAGLVAEAARQETHSRRVRRAMGSNVTVKSSTEFVAHIGPSKRHAWFAHFLEFGTEPHEETRFGRRFIGPQQPFSHPGSRAFPFLRPALVFTEDEIVELVGVPPVLR